LLHCLRSHKGPPRPLGYRSLCLPGERFKNLYDGYIVFVTIADLNGGEKEFAGARRAGAAFQSRTPAHAKSVERGYDMAIGMIWKELRVTS